MSVTGPSGTVLRHPPGSRTCATVPAVCLGVGLVVGLFVAAFFVAGLSVLGPAGVVEGAEPVAGPAAAATPSTEKPGPQAAARVPDAGPAGVATEKQAAAAPRNPRRKAAPVIAHVVLSGGLPDGVGQGGLLADVAPHLHRIVERMDKAAKDPRVKAVLVSIQSPELGRARAEEIRAAISRVRAAGKPVAAHLVGSAPVHYLAGLACDTITLAPAATLEITGVRVEMQFFRSLLDRLGIAAEILQVGDFKGAGEPLTRDGMSPQLRAQYESFVTDLFEQFVARIAADRRLPEARVRELVDVGVFTPEAARDAGLVDAVGYEDEAVTALARTIGEAGADEPKVARDYGERKFDRDFSGIGGLVKLVELLSGQGQDSPVGKGRRIAIVHVTGAIREGKGRDDLLGGGAAGSESVIDAIREAATDDKVAAIVLRIDSPGGSALASDLIWREIERTKKPVVASLSDVAASGGYYVAVAADRIVAAPGTLTGSIGVVGGKLAVGQGLERIGVHTDVVAKGRNSGWLSLQTPFSETERQVFLATMRDVYRLFTTKVAAGRRLDIERVAALAEGRVFTGRMAHEIGLVDRLGTLEDAVAEARSLAGIAPDEEIERQLLPEPRGLFDDLFAASPGRVNPAAGLVARLAGDAAVTAAGLDRLPLGVGLWLAAADAHALTEVISGRPLLILPARISIR